MPPSAGSRHSLERVTVATCPPNESGMSSSGLTFDTGMLIALERRRQRAWHVYRTAMAGKVPITVPTAVIAEWWRGRTDAREHVRSGLVLEALSDALARLAGEALADVPDATTIDAIVMASAASRGDVVYTSDFEDLEKLSSFFPGVRLLSI
jgi:aminopeptidase-like protein